MAYNPVGGAGLVANAVAGSEVQTESQIKLQNFWDLEKADVEEMKPKQVNAQDVFKQQDLPLARIKKIMKLDEDLKNMMISAEAPVLFAKAAELFIREITLRAWIHTERNKRRTLQRNDIAMAVADPDTDMFDFLIDIVPREEVKPSQPRREETVTAGATTQGSVPAVTQVQQLQQPVQYVFQIPGQQCPQSIQILMPQQFQQAGATALTNGNGTTTATAATAAAAAAGTDVAQMVTGPGGMQVVQLMAPQTQQQQQGGMTTITHVDAANSQGSTVVRTGATNLPVAAQQPMVVSAITPQPIQIQNLGGQTQSVMITPQRATSGTVVTTNAATAGGTVSTVGSTTAGTTVSSEVTQQADVSSSLNAVGAPEVVVKTDPMDDETSSPTQDGVMYQAQKQAEPIDSQLEVVRADNV